MKLRLIVAAAPLVFAMPFAGQGPVFRSAVDVVAVDVAVRSGDRPVAGLLPADFEVTDNGQTQTLADVTHETLPIDVTLIIDLSGSVEGALLESLSRAVDQIGQRLRPDDRVNIVKFNMRIREISRAQPATANLAASLGAPTGPTSLLDALAVSLIRPGSPDRRQMAILFTDGADTDSFTDESAVEAVAARVDSTIFIVAVTNGTALYPQDPPHKKLFQNLTSLTGGQLAILPRNRDLGASFVQALEEFRTSYVLRYVFAGSRRPGWHDIGVRITRPGRFDVRARRGYFVSGR